MPRPPKHRNLDHRLLELIAAADSQVVSKAVSEFSISRQAINKHLRSLVKSGVIEASGSTKSRRYKLVEVGQTRTFALAGLNEHDVWANFARGIARSSV